MYAEQLRDLFINKASDKWEELVKAEIRDAKKNYKARHYIFDQVIGRPKESGELKTKLAYNIDARIVENINKIYGKN